MELRGVNINGGVSIKTLNYVDSGLVLDLDAGNPQSYPGTGTTWFDLAPPPNNGELVLNITYDSNDGGSLVFPNPNTGVGTTSYVRMNRVTEFMPTSAISIEQWLNPDSWIPVTGQQSISNTQGGGYAISLRNGGVDFIVFAGGSYRNSRLLDSSILSGWNQVVATFDGRYVKMYINGVDTGVGTDIGSTQSITYNATNGLFIGAEAGSSATVPDQIQSYQGKISITRIYNRGLSALEVGQNFNAVRSRYSL